MSRALRRPTIVFALALCAGAAVAQDSREVLSGVLQVERRFDAIELTLDRVQLEAHDPLSLAVLAGREVELVVAREGRERARVLSVASPQAWQGEGDTRWTAEAGLEIVGSGALFRVRGLPAGTDRLLANRRLEARGWAYPEAGELVFTSVFATVLKPSFVNERTLDAEGRAVYEARLELRVGERVRVFDINAYAKARRDAQGRVVEPGAWRQNLQAARPGDVLMARVAVLESTGASGWLPLDRLTFRATVHAAGGLASSLSGQRELPPLEREQGVPPMDREQTTLPPLEREQGVPPMEREQTTLPVEREQGVPPLDREQTTLPVEREQRTIDLPLGD